MYTWTDGTYLAHHGIKGQKWGVRRFQNPDGSYTDEGRRRRLGAPNKFQNLSDAQLGAQYKKHQKIMVPTLTAAMAVNIGIEAVSAIKYGGGYKNKSQKYISIGAKLVPVLLYAMDLPYQKEIARRTGTKTLTFDKPQNATKEEWIKNNGGYLPFQEKAYNKRNNA